MLFQSDPARFWQAVANEDAEQRVVATCASADDMLLCEVLRYGIQN
jgi:hypothetical protein